MTWLSINPNAVSQQALETAAYILSQSPDHHISADDAEFLDSIELADAFNVIDPEVTQLACYPYEEDED